MRDFKKKVDGFIEQAAAKRVQEMVAALANATPVDTGRAKSEWSYKQASSGKFIIINGVEYIKHLNAGTSKQAPAFFVEKIAMQFGKPKGVIVNYSK